MMRSAGMTAQESGCWKRRPSLRLDAGVLDDRPPFVDLGLLEFGESVRRLQLARRDIEAKLGKALAHRFIGERLHHGAVDLGHDLLPRAPPPHQAPPTPRY